MAHVGKEGVTAAIHDHIKGRQSEMSLVSGLVARAGEKFGIPVICNAAVTEIDRRINEGEIPMDPSNFGLLKSMIESIDIDTKDDWKIAKKLTNIKFN